ncbi:hypothetical protein GCM10027091_62110 [Streptomyces daliensis]
MAANASDDGSAELPSTGADAEGEGAAAVGAGARAGPAVPVVVDPVRSFMSLSSLAPRLAPHPCPLRRAAALSAVPCPPRTRAHAGMPGPGGRLMLVNSSIRLTLTNTRV